MQHNMTEKLIKLQKLKLLKRAHILQEEHKDIHIYETIEFIW
jgi:hypothetical protein